ncbi:L,D-transpeptidase family protein [Nocardiopsis trehalosi]|jgi:peptidoglycan hydrolase-like protein with peptidoglycan-binding domain|uniref:L,D-transpeptidase family protein n=1 Tax=Nocardiopsis trehalosi TaxID=109329 RepID=UPI000830B870|nr:L,D-transpeptidase family protein [Nocardiopsis trehalosi]
MATRSPGRFARSTARAAAIALAAAVAAGTGLAAAAPASAAAPAARENPAAFLWGASELRAGDSGREVEALQERLIELGYWIDAPDGEFGGNTVQAVYALQKAAGIARDGIVGPDTRKALDDGVRPSAGSSSGDVIEIDLERQLLLVVSDGEVQQTFNTSTGSGETYESRGEEAVAVTPVGQYSVFRGVDAWDPGPLGSLYRPKYFNGGIAVHGYPSVPPVPASHGCARVSLAAMDWLWESGRLDNGSTVLVR